MGRVILAFFLLFSGIMCLGADDTVTNKAASFESAGDMFFLFVGAVMVFSMHAGFAFLELGTVKEEKPGERAQ